MSKLTERAKSSKLRQSLVNNHAIESPEKIIRNIKYKEYPRSYRVDERTMNTLKSTLDRINEYSHKKVSEARLLKALILLSSDIGEEKLLKAIKEVW